MPRYKVEMAEDIYIKAVVKVLGEKPGDNLEPADMHRLAHMSIKAANVFNAVQNEYDSNLEKKDK